MALKKALIEPALEGVLSHHFAYFSAGLRRRVCRCEPSTAAQWQSSPLEGMNSCEAKPGLAFGLKSGLFRQRVAGWVTQAGQESRQRDIFVQSAPVQALSGQPALLGTGLASRCQPFNGGHWPL